MAVSQGALAVCASVVPEVSSSGAPWVDVSVAGVEPVFVFCSASRKVVAVVVSHPCGTCCPRIQSVGGDLMGELQVVVVVVAPHGQLLKVNKFVLLIRRFESENWSNDIAVPILCLPTNVKQTSFMSIMAL